MNRRGFLGAVFCGAAAPFVKAEDKAAQRPYYYDVKPAVEYINNPDVEIDVESVRAEIEAYESGLKRYMTFIDMSVKRVPLDAQV